MLEGILGNYTCPSPPVPLNGHNNWEKGKVLVTFGCYSGFHLVGHSKSRCQNGRWSFDAQPECLPFEPRCPYPGDPYNGQTVPRKDVYQVNETVRYQCAEGFSTTGVGKGTCQSNGSWDFRPSPCGKLKSSKISRWTFQYHGILFNWLAGIDLAFRTQPFTSFGLDLDHLSRFHPELVDRNESTCFNLGGLALLGGSKPWLIGWNRLATLPEFPILRFVFDPEGILLLKTNVRLKLVMEFSVIRCKRKRSQGIAWEESSLDTAPSSLLQWMDFPFNDEE